MADKAKVITILFLVFLGLYYFGNSGKDNNSQIKSDKPALDKLSQEDGSVILPEIDKFLSENKKYGVPVKVKAVPDWAQGKRQLVGVDSNGKFRTLLFYTKDKKVVTVYENSPDGRKKIWGDYQKLEEFTPVNRETSDSLPAYSVLFSNKKIGGGKFGDILIPSFSRQTPVKKRETIFRSISAKEGIEDVSFYSAEEAYKANVSASFAKSHPNAMRDGFLGTLREGKFTAGETLYP